MTGPDWSGIPAHSVDLTVANHATTDHPQPEDGLSANPVREYLEAIAVELLIAKGDVRQAWKHALSLALEHSYGLEASEAEAKVEQATLTADQHLKDDAAEGMEWDAVKYDRARDMVTWAVLR